MKKVFLISLILTALLIGLSVCIQAQNKKRESPKKRMERIKREKAAKDSVNTVSYEQKIQQLEKEKAEQDKLLQAQANAKAEVEQKLANSKKANSELKNQVDANKADADRLAKQLLETKMILMQKEQQEQQYQEQQDQINAKEADPVIAENSVIQENPVSADSTKKDSVKVKKVVTHTRVLATMVKGDTAFVPVKDKKLVPIQKKGTIIILAEGDPVENIARIRKSDVEKNQAKIDELIGLGYTLEEVNK